jgi:hypothetical protein
LTINQIYSLFPPFVPFSIDMNRVDARESDQAFKEQTRRVPFTRLRTRVQFIIVHKAYTSQRRRWRSLTTMLQIRFYQGCIFLPFIARDHLGCGWVDIWQPTTPFWKYSAWHFGEILLHYADRDSAGRSGYLTIWAFHIQQHLTWSFLWLELYFLIRTASMNLKDSSNSNICKPSNIDVALIKRRHGSVYRQQQQMPSSRFQGHSGAIRTNCTTMMTQQRNTCTCSVVWD